MNNIEFVYVLNAANDLLEDFAGLRLGNSVYEL